VDYPALERLINWQIESGIDALVICGTTGECSTLTDEEHRQVLKFSLAVAAGRVPMIAGTGSNDVAYAIELTKYACEVGADAMLLVTPYYNKPTQEGLYRHFSTVADTVGLPVVLYNVPGRSGVPIAESTVARLAKNPAIVAVKEAAGSVERVSAILDICDITVLSGDDSLTLPMISVGAKGIISVSSNLIPAEMVEMTDAALKGDFARALELHRKYYRFFKDEFIETKPIPIKAALAMAGMMTEEYRLPLCELAPEHREKLAETLKRCGIIQ
jgi:4-hydroxy-tetrahydrodipicolinate synthase